MDIKNYQVSYTIDVNSTNGVNGVNNFVDSISKLSAAKDSIKNTSSEIRAAFDSINNAFVKKRGAGRDGSNLKLSVDVSALKRGASEANSQLDKLAAKASKIRIGKLNSGKDNTGVLATVKSLNSALETTSKKLNSITKEKEVKLKTGTAMKNLESLNRILSEIQTKASSIGIAPGPIGVSSRSTAQRGAKAPTALDVRKAAINRMQYSQLPTLRSIPFVGMFNAYMAYGAVKSNVADAIEYANIMTSAKSILKVADGDLSTFETRFQKMAQTVRQIGVETKFTSREIASATKFLSMAGMDMQTIQNSMRPIANLALIGDNDISQVADLATNIMSGYGIGKGGMESVADMIASTTARSNVNIIEMAESYKMAAGHLRLSGVEFAEASAAIGILGNSGIKGTMAGTALRAMSTRFAKPTKEAQDALDRLGIKFTEDIVVYGKTVERLKPLHKIFEELNKSGASLEDLQTIFGKIGGNASMMFIDNYKELGRLTNQNKASHGMADYQAKVKQNTTTAGLWAQTTSQVSEGFQQAYEMLEPTIQSVLRSLNEKFKAREFAEGLASVGRAFVNIFEIVSKTGTWIVKNMSWIEPIFFTTLAATKLFKLSGAITNVAYAIGLLGRQQAGLSALSMVGFGGKSFAEKRAIVAARGAKGGAGLMATQQKIGSGLMGAWGAMSAVGLAAPFISAGLSVIASGAIYAATKTWQLKQAMDSVEETITRDGVYTFPTIDALTASLKKAKEEASGLNQKVEELGTKSVKDTTGVSTGWFSDSWWGTVTNNIKSALPSLAGFAGGPLNGVMGLVAGSIKGGKRFESFDDNYQKAVREQIKRFAKMDEIAAKKTLYADLSGYSTPAEVDAYLGKYKDKFGFKGSLDQTLYKRDKNGNAVYNQGMDDKEAIKLAGTPDFARLKNESLTGIKNTIVGYRNAIASTHGAQNFLKNTGFDYKELTDNGFYFDSVSKKWTTKPLSNNSSEEDRAKAKVNYDTVNKYLKDEISRISAAFDGNSSMTYNILRAAGFDDHLFDNTPEPNKNPWDASRITNLGSSEEDDFYGGGSGSGSGSGGRSGLGKLTSVSPKQVIVNITNLLSVQTIELMKSPDGQTAEIQNIKELMAQALIDVVHDFDASWNA